MIRQTFLEEAGVWVYSWGTGIGHTVAPAFSTPNSLYHLVIGFGTGVSIFGYNGTLHSGETITVLDYTKALEANGDLKVKVSDLQKTIAEQQTEIQGLKKGSKSWFGKPWFGKS